MTKEECEIETSKAIMEMRNQIAELEKENAELTKAKEIIKEMLSILPKENIEGVYEITEEAEQFIRELEQLRKVIYLKPTMKR